MKALISVPDRVSPARHSLARAALCQFLSRGETAHQRGADGYLAALFPDDKAALQILRPETRAAVTGAQTNVAGWAQELVATAVGEFVSTLPGSAASKLISRGTQVTFPPGVGSVKTPVRAAGPAVAGWVAEGDEIPAKALPAERGRSRAQESRGADRAQQGVVATQFCRTDLHVDAERRRGIHDRRYLLFSGRSHGRGFGWLVERRDCDHASRPDRRSSEPRRRRSWSARRSGKLNTGSSGEVLFIMAPPQAAQAFVVAPQSASGAQSIAPQGPHEPRGDHGRGRAQPGSRHLRHRGAHHGGPARRA